MSTGPALFLYMHVRFVSQKVFIKLLRTLELLDLYGNMMQLAILLNKYTDYVHVFCMLKIDKITIIWCYSLIFNNCLTGFLDNDINRASWYPK